MEPQLNRLEVEYVGNVVVVKFRDKRILGKETIIAIGEELFGLVNKRQVNILLNFSGVEYISTVFVGKLITLRNMINKAKRKLIFYCVDQHIYDILRIMRLTEGFADGFEFAKDEATALSLFGQ